MPGSRFWEWLRHHQSHVEWVGCSLHDLIQPSFSFLVGVALPFSMAGRLARGQSKAKMTAHALWRSLILVALGIFLRSRNSDQTNFTFEDTLSQIGLGYTFLFVLAFFSRGCSGSPWGSSSSATGRPSHFIRSPAPNSTMPRPAFRGLLRTPRRVRGSLGYQQQRRLGLRHLVPEPIPRKRPFVGNGGGYSTLSFIPTLATMILGLLAGGVLRGSWRGWSKVLWLIVAGLIGLAAGWGLGELGICPVVKKIWTPSWVLFSGGWCLLFLAGFYAVLDLLGFQSWAFPLRVIGMNSIAAYCMAALFENFIARNLRTHLGRSFSRSSAIHTSLCSTARPSC